MEWPTTTDYAEAVQRPRAFLADEELREGEVARTPLGLPMLWSGNFADVYKIHCPATGSTWALKCFTRQVPDLQARYLAIAAHLEQANLRSAGGVGNFRRISWAGKFCGNEDTERRSEPHAARLLARLLSPTRGVSAARGIGKKVTTNSLDVS